jgi:hypothetical protein
MAGLGKAMYSLGFWIRETGQALDRLGCRLQGNYFFHEQSKRRCPAALLLPTKSPSSVCRFVFPLRP